MSFGPTSLLWLVIIGALVVIPFYRLLPHYGMNKYYAFFAIVPAIALVFLWLMAFKDDIEGQG